MQGMEESVEDLDTALGATDTSDEESDSDNTINIPQLGELFCDIRECLDYNGYAGADDIQSQTDQINRLADYVNEALGILQHINTNDLKTKAAAISVLADIIEYMWQVPEKYSIMGFRKHLAWTELWLQSSLPAALAAAMLRIGHTMTDAEFETTKEGILQHRFLFAQRYELPGIQGHRPFSDLNQFLFLAASRTHVYDFDAEYVKIKEVLVNPPHTPEDLDRDHSLKSAQKVIENVITEKINWAVTTRSSNGTMVNAFKMLTKLAKLFNTVRVGPHSDTFVDGGVDDIVIDTMIKVCDLADYQGFDIAGIVDQESRDALLQLQEIYGTEHEKFRPFLELLGITA